MYFDFIPSSENYNILKNAKVQIEVNPRSLYVRIRDAYSLVGEELSIPEYQIVSPLVDGDGIESLGVRIENDADKDVASMTYKTLVRFQIRTTLPIATAMKASLRTTADISCTQNRLKSSRRTDKILRFLRRRTCRRFHKSRAHRD